MKSLVPRHAMTTALEILGYAPCLVIEGARQVGKSTLAGQLAANTRAIVTNLDDPATLASAREDPPGFVAQAGQATLVIDEIQHAPHLTLALKSSIDQDRRPGRFILTGSTSFLRLKGSADSLAGRIGRLPLYGFSQGELRGNDDDFVAALSRASDHHIATFATSHTRPDYVRMVTQGSYPPSVALLPRAHRRWQEDYLDALIRRDMPELRKSVDPTRTMSLLRLLASHQSGELNRAKLAQEANLPASTVTGYLDLLTDLYLLAILPAWGANLTAREIARPKAFIRDSGQAAALNRLTADHLGSPGYGQIFGSLLEGFVTQELAKQATWADIPFTMYHYRDRAGVEVDLILELDGGDIIAIEVKASTSFLPTHFHGLKYLRDKLGNRLRAGVVLNTGVTGFRFADQLYGLPISALWEFTPGESMPVVQ